MDVKRAMFVYMTSHPKGDGAVLLPPVRLFREVSALESAGWQVSIVEIERIDAPPIRNLVRRARHLNKITKIMLETIGNQLRAVRTPDLLVAHDIEVLPAVARVAEDWSIPLVYDSHEHWPYLIRENSRIEALAADIIERRLMLRVNHVVTVSDSIAKRFRNLGKPTTVLYNARPRDEIRLVPRKDAKAELGLPANAFIMGFVGNTNLLVKHDRPIDMILDALERISDAHLLIVGGPDSEEIKDMAWDRGVNTQVRAYGPLPYHKLIPYYGALDLGLIPLSDIPIHNVSVGNKVFDYMARGIPLFAPETAVDTTEIIRRNFCGWTYSPKTFRPMLETIINAPDDRRERGYLGKSAFDHEYCWDIQAPRFVETCESLIVPLT